MDIERPKSKQPIPAHAKKIFSGQIFDVYQWEQEMFDGTTEIFEKLKRPDTVVVFPVLPDGRILLTEQEQPGKEPFIGATGGRVDEEEGILEAAKRELLEESGYKAEKFILWDAQQPVGKIEWAIYTFVAKGLTKIAGPDLDPGEKITLKPVSFDEFVEMASNERFAEKAVTYKLLEARTNPGKEEELNKLFSPEY
jgi:ADP-ribose pyrophosphatase